MLNITRKYFEHFKAKMRNFCYEIIFLFKSENQDLVITTGADSSHFMSLCQLLSTLMIHESQTKTVVYDLGLSQSERDYITTNFTSLDLRVFDYSKYPPYLNIKINAGEYAWKPVILNQVLNEFKCTVCWLDAGNVVTEPLVKLRKITEWNGFYSPWASGTIADWTHPKTLDYMKVKKSILDKYNLAGGCVSANYHNEEAAVLIEKWAKCALIKECIAPEGSNRDNHRQDQAVLSVLAYQSDLGKWMTKRYLGFKVHQDID